MKKLSQKYVVSFAVEKTLNLQKSYQTGITRFMVETE